ncbi:MAG: hypothetical protein JOZ75_14965, partial [Candidatus Dormibacteraeota bacterium]|nr:hypothetical protein [Candidatus Dormibacteraeota bacterium]
MILQALIVFSLGLGVTTALALLPRLITARAWLSLPLAAGALALTAWLASLILGDAGVARDDTIVIAVLALLMRALQRRWSWIGTQLFVTVALTSLTYLVYAATLTYAAGLSALVIAASTVLLLLEIAALAL